MAKKTIKKVSAKKATKKVAKKATTKKAVKKATPPKKQEKSVERNYVIQFDLNKLAKHVHANIQKKQQEEKNQIIESSNFWYWLKEQPKLNLQTFENDFNHPVYRVYPSQFDVTSVVGSISCGARLNIGANQVIKEFFPFTMFGALYLATSMNCAIMEYTHGTPLNSNDIRYTLQPQKNFKLWDLDQVIENLSYPSIKILINRPPIGGGWDNCKVPMPSQILSWWLKNIGGDGIIFTSTQDPSEKIVMIFTKDDKEFEKNFSVINQTNI